jgi:hypothetical protein
MQKYCQNPLCKRVSTGEVSISAEGPAIEMKSLCAACKMAFDWGVQHNKTALQGKAVWVLAVDYKGTIIHTKALGSMAKAVKALAEHLKTEEGYAGPADMRDICNWMAQHDDRLTASIIHALLDLS